MRETVFGGLWYRAQWFSTRSAWTCNVKVIL